MKIAICPEEIIWEYIARKLGLCKEHTLSHQKHLGLMPDSIEISEEFLPYWQKVVQNAVRKAIVETFKFRTFLILERDQVRRVSVADKEFWQEIALPFSIGAVDRIWEIIISRSKSSEPIWDLALSGDLLFLCSLDRENYDRYSYARLKANKAPWIVVAMFLQNQIFFNPDKLPWKVFLEKPAEIPLPLRELMIQKTSEFFESMTRGLNDYVKGERGSAESTSLQSSTQFRFYFSHRDDVLHHNNGQDPYGIALIEKAVDFWKGEGTLGLDDDRYIEGANQQYSLIKNIQEYKTNLDLLRDITAQQNPETGKGEPPSFWDVVTRNDPKPKE